MTRLTKNKYALSKIIIHGKIEDQINVDLVFPLSVDYLDGMASSWLNS